MDMKALLRALALLPGMAFATAALAQSAQQVLDTVVAYGTTKAYEIKLANGTAAGVPLGAPVESTLRACKLTANRGLFCVDAAKNVVNWKNPDSSDDGQVLFNCNQVGEFDTRSSETCTAITLDPAGNIWLAGKNKGKTHSLVKVEQCSEGSWTTSSGSLCTKLWATGRPLLLDVEYIGGDAAAAFTFGAGGRQLGAGILGLQERKTVVFFPAVDTAGLGTPVLEPADITEISSGKAGWGLVGNEQLQSVTLLQPSGTTDDFVLVLANTGRIIAMNTRTLQPAAAGQESDCGSGSRAAQYGVRASAKTGRVYTTSKTCSSFTVWKPQVTSGDAETKLTLVADAGVAGNPVHLATAPEGPTIAPGIGIDLGDCSAGCPVTLGATLFLGNSLASEEAGLIAFQVKNIPDCRWNDAPACAGKDVIVSQPELVDDPATQYLNVTPLLPSEITDLFPAPNQLPPLLISPQYRGQNGVFEAFFYVTEEGVRFSGAFEAEYEVADLAGSSLGCIPTENLLEWDVATRVSERFISVGGPVGYDHVDTLINTGCGSLITKKPGFSLVPYNLEITPDTYYNTGRVIRNNDAVFARLLQKLHDEFREVLTTRACYVNVDTAGSPPLSDGYCDALIATYDDAKAKLDRCFAATYQPKTSAGSQNCQSFESQFKQFTGLLALAAPNGPDPANRIGELEARVAVMQHVYETRFLPSVPFLGFCEDNCP